MLEGAAPARSAGVRHRGFAKPRNPRRGGLADGKTKVLAGWFAGARCPAVKFPMRPRSRAKPGDEIAYWNLGRKKEPRRGRPGIKEGLFRRTAFCLKESQKFLFF